MLGHKNSQGLLKLRPGRVAWWLKRVHLEEIASGNFKSEDVLLTYLRIGLPHPV